MVKKWPKVARCRGGSEAAHGNTKRRESTNRRWIIGCVSSNLTQSWQRCRDMDVDNKRLTGICNRPATASVGGRPRASAFRRNAEASPPPPSLPSRPDYRKERKCCCCTEDHFLEIDWTDRQTHGATNWFRWNEMVKLPIDEGGMEVKLRDLFSALAHVNMHATRRWGCR